MDNTDFRKLVLDMRMAQKAAHSAAKRKPKYEHFDNIKRWQETSRACFEEYRRVLAAIDRELGLLPSEV